MISVADNSTWDCAVFDLRLEWLPKSGLVSGLVCG